MCFCLFQLKALRLGDNLSLLMDYVTWRNFEICTSGIMFSRHPCSQVNSLRCWSSISSLQYHVATSTVRVNGLLIDNSSRVPNAIIILVRHLTWLLALPKRLRCLI